MKDDGLWYRCRDFVTEQSAGEWSDKDIANDSDLLMEFVRKEISAALALSSAGRGAPQSWIEAKAEVDSGCPDRATVGGEK